MRILVTGGAGFIGSHLVDRLTSDGHTVAVLDSLSTGKKEYVNHRAEFIELDVTEEAARKAAVKFKPEIIYHLAAQKSLSYSIDHPVEDAEVNILGTLNVLESARATKARVIFTSTAAVYGAAAVPITEDTLVKPETPYGIAKAAAEHYLNFYSRYYKLQTVALRFSNVYGPRQDPYGEAGVIALFIDGILKGKELAVHGDGRQTRDFLYVGDAVEALIKAMNATGTFDIGSDTETSVFDLVKILEKIHGAKVAYQLKPDADPGVRRSYFDSKKAKRELKWRAKVSINDGLKTTYQWLNND